MGQTSRAKVAVLVGAKGRGSNMEALARASASEASRFQVALVVSTSASSPALLRAQSLDLKTVALEPGDGFGGRLIRALRDDRVDWLCLAGFLSVLPSDVLRAFPGRVLNIHPSLLPKFGGKGMYGTKVHQAVIGAGETESGCTVHFVTERYDEGEHVLQKRCPVFPTDTPETLAARVLALEHEAYPEALNMVVGS